MSTVEEELFMRASIESAAAGALAAADSLAERIIRKAADPAAVTLALTYQDLRKLERRLRRALNLEVSG